MNNWKTEQEAFWASEFGTGYMERNDSLIGSNEVLFGKIIQKMAKAPASVLELGANIGLNVAALNHILPGTKVSAVEINSLAAEQLRKLDCEVFETSILDFAPKSKYDLVFTKGVLIHINPAELSNVYELMYKSTNKYILVAEYYNPTPVTITYHGQEDRLFKRDFAGELLDRFSDLKLVDYGFTYHRDIFPQDDLTWFLLEK